MKKVLDSIDIEITDLGRPLTQNTQRHLSGYQYRDKTRQWRQAAAKLWAEANPENLRLSGCTITATPTYLNRQNLPDTANTYPSVKAAIDGAIDAGILKDDNAKYVQTIIQHAPKPNAKTVGLRITITGYKNENT